MEPPKFVIMSLKTTIIVHLVFKFYLENEETRFKLYLNPDYAEVVKGYNKGLMLSYEGQITEEDMEHIIDYFKTLK